MLTQVTNSFDLVQAYRYKLKVHVSVSLIFNRFIINPMILIYVHQLPHMYISNKPTYEEIHISKHIH